MTFGNCRIENIILAGAYGDKEVHLCCCVPEDANGVNIVLLHGVHSSANLGQHNKFRHLAKTLAELGYTSWLVETSRRTRCRQDYGDDISAWVEAAFSGKTFQQEQADVFAAIGEVLRRAAGASLWVWGFSLGGIIALSAAANFDSPYGPARPAIDGVVVSGTGLVAYPEVESFMLELPILSTLRSTLSEDMLFKVKTDSLVSFRGSEDEIFSLESCRQLVSDVPLPDGKKHFFPIEGADHSLRTRFGKQDPCIMEEMAAKIDAVRRSAKK